MEDFVELFRSARAEGLGVTLHIAEVTNAHPLSECSHRNIIALVSDKGKFCGGNNETPML